MHNSTSEANGSQVTTDNRRAQFWDKIAEGYSRRPVADPAAFERKIALTKERMKPNDVVLDIGCGTGSLALILAPFARHVHGLDVSGQMIRIARAKAEVQKATNVSFHVGEFASPLEFEPESFDVICAYSLLHLLEDPSTALGHIHRLLKPGGFFIGSNLCLGESWVPYGPVIRLMRLVGKAPFVNILSKADMLRLLQSAGFIEITTPDVGAKDEVAFTIATKPSSL